MEKNVNARTLLLATLSHLLPASCCLLPVPLSRFRMALWDWNRLSPMRQRLPFPLVALRAVIGVLLEENDITLALFLFVAPFTRPGETVKLCVNQLVFPALHFGNGSATWGTLLSRASRGAPVKTGQHDESVMLDDHQWLYPFPMTPVSGRPSEDRVFPSELVSIRARSSAVCGRLGLAAPQPCLYGLRHGGASYVFLMCLRNVAEINMRGKCSSDQSLNLYGKESRPLQETHNKSPPTVLFGPHMEAKRVTVFHSRSTARSPAPVNEEIVPAPPVRRRSAERR